MKYVVPCFTNNLKPNKRQQNYMIWKWMNGKLVKFKEITRMNRVNEKSQILKNTLLIEELFLWGCIFHYWEQMNVPLRWGRFINTRNYSKEGLKVFQTLTKHTQINQKQNHIIPISFCPFLVPLVKSLAEESINPITGGGFWPRITFFESLWVKIEHFPNSK